MVFQERGASGASVLTANGLEHRDVHDRPEPIVRRSVDEPWRAPLGFILPADGRFTQTSRPHMLATTGLAIVLRPSDTRVPAWGGEVLVRVDLIAPAAEGTARWGENVAVVLDGDGESTKELVSLALSRLAGRDRVLLVDARGAKVVVPKLPASNRSMAMATLESRLRRKARAAEPRDLAKAVDLARETLMKGRAADVTARLLVLSERSLDEAASDAVGRAASGGVQTSVVVTAAGEPDEIRERVRDAIPEAGRTMFRDVALTFQGTPAPSHVLEASGGEALWQLDAGVLRLGNVHAGEARTEVVRVSVPAWQAGEKFHFTVTAHVDDLAWGGPRAFSAEVPCVYDDDLTRIAKSRHGDVIAYASALATQKRLDAAFADSSGLASHGALLRIAKLHAESMRLLADDSKDFAAKEQADTLAALLAGE